MQEEEKLKKLMSANIPEASQTTNNLMEKY
jgi:hypothetical protein